MNANITCPKCGEQSPSGAATCWLCHTPFGALAVQGFEAQNEGDRRRARRRKLVDAALLTSLLGGVCLAIVSGFLPRRRFSVLGLGGLAVSAPTVWMGWRDIQAKHEQSKTQATRQQEAELGARIAEAILFHTAKDGSPQLRLCVGTLGIHLCAYKGDGWQEQMKIPLSMWDRLEAYFRLLSDNWKRPVRFKIGDQGFSYTLQPERDYPHEALLWTREDVVFLPQELAQLMELETHGMNHESQICPKCGEANPTEAVMCWACYTPLTEDAQQRVVKKNARYGWKGERRQRVEWQAVLVLLLGGTSTLVASGYSARNRRELLSIGTFALLLFGVLLQCDAIQSKRRRAETQLLVESPAVRYVNEILRYSILQDAEQIRFQTGYRALSVEYLVGEEWKKGAPIPSELWSGIRAELAQKSGDWRNAIRVTMQGHPFFYAAHFERDSLNETLTLTRQKVN